MRLLIIGPNEMLVSLLERVLGAEDDIDVVGAITDPAEAYRYREAAEIVAFHADIAGAGLFDGIRRLREQLPSTRVVLLHAPDLHDVVIGAIEVGAVGYVHSQESVEQMLATLRTVHEHGVAIDPKFMSVLVERMANLSRQVRSQAQLQFDPDATLTNRQLEVLELIHQGLTNDEISERLYISTGTVKNHVHNILKALDADNREQAAYWYTLHHEAGVTVGPDGLISMNGSQDGASVLDLAIQPSTRSTIAEKLERYCRQLGWSIGHAYLIDTATQELVPTGIWYVDDSQRYRKFQEMTMQHRFTAGKGVVGNILFSPEPVWVADISSYPGYVRYEAALAAGLESGLILPLFDGELIGAMEFYAIQKAQPDPQVVADIMISSKKLGDDLDEQAEQLETKTRR